MSLNIFDGSFAFQRTLIDSDSVNGSKKDFVPANDRDTFKISERSDNRAAERSKKSDDDFSKFLKSAQNDKKVQEPETKDQDVRDTFSTQESGVELVAPSGIILSDGVDDVDITALLENLSDELRAFIDDLVTRTEEEGRNIVTEVIVSSGEEVPTVNSLLGLFVNLAHSDSDKAALGFGEQGLSLSTLVKTVQDLSDEDGVQALTSNLTPTDIADLQEKIAAYLNGQITPADEKALSAFAAHIISLVEPNSTYKGMKDASSATSSVNGHTELASPLLAHDVPTAAVRTSPPAPSRFDGRYDAPAQASTPQTGEQTNASSAQKPENTAPNQTPVKPHAAPSTGEKFLQLLQASSGAFPSLDSITTPQQAGQALQALPSSQASLTNVITQSASATQAHPATQLVSATIQKAVKAGEDTNIKMRLDPPELGRVEVKMSIDKDNKARIVLTVEKPETFLMLQRDADALHRAMADAGLDTQGDLNFELASEDHDFEQAQRGRSDGSDTDDELIEETTLDVQIDPVTGHVRTDILV